MPQQIKTRQSERKSLFISPRVNHHHHPRSSSSATDSRGRVHTQLYLSIESNRKICRLQFGHRSIRKTTETMKPKSSPSPPAGRGVGDQEDRDRSGWYEACRGSEPAQVLDPGPRSTPAFESFLRGCKPRPLTPRRRRWLTSCRTLQRARGVMSHGPAAAGFLAWRRPDGRRQKDEQRQWSLAVLRLFEHIRSFFFVRHKHVN